MKNYLFSLSFILLSLGMPIEGVIAQNNTGPEEELVVLIKQQQDLYIKKSCNTSSLFMDTDLTNFIANRTPDLIAEKLEAKTSFIRLMDQIKTLPADQRMKLIATARKTYQPTWAEDGRISCEGQTDAGQTAQKLAAEAIVDLVEEMIEQ